MAQTRVGPGNRGCGTLTRMDTPESSMQSQPEAAGRACLEEIGMLALEYGRLLMEAGASARDVEEITTQVSCGMGAEHTELRVGYASLAITVSARADAVTCMRKVGHLGVNQRLDYLLRLAAARIERGEFSRVEVRRELERLARTAPRHSEWVVGVAVGLACAAFGRLLGVDWAGVGPIFLAAMLAQMVRRRLALRNLNVFVAATVVAFLGSALSGLGARWAGSQTIALDMTAPVLLLVPGVPLLNAQDDILEGRPTLGSARAVWVAVVLVFITAGVWLAQVLLGELN